MNTKVQSPMPNVQSNDLEVLPPPLPATPMNAVERDINLKMLRDHLEMAYRMETIRNHGMARSELNEALNVLERLARK